jgi:hypothetical protein
VPALVLAATAAVALVTITSASAVSGNKITVGVSNTKLCKDPDVSTITAGINAASDGDFIYVCPGTYNESLTVNKSVTILGTNGRIGPKPQRCLKESSYPGTEPDVDAVVTGTVNVTAANVTLKQMTFTNAGTAITVGAGAGSFKLDGGVLQNNSTGLLLNGADQTVTFSCFRHDSTGISGPGSLVTALIDHSYFFSNGTGINLAAGASDVTADSLYTRSDSQFFVATGTNLEITHNATSSGSGDGIVLNGPTANTGLVSGNQFQHLGGTGINIVNNGLDNSQIEFSFIKKNTGDGISIDPASTGNILFKNRLNTNTGIDCNDQTAGPANNWTVDPAGGNRGDEATYTTPPICGGKAVHS